MKYLVLFCFMACSNSPESGHKGINSIFLYHPVTERDLGKNGYTFNEPFKMYYKKVNDTIEHLEILNLDSGQFRKRFFIRIAPHDSAGAGRVLEFIYKNMDSVCLQLKDGGLVRCQHSLYFITIGFTGSPRQNLYTITYYNMAAKDDKSFAIDYLKEELKYSSGEMTQKITAALNEIDKVRDDFPSQAIDSTVIKQSNFSGR